MMKKQQKLRLADRWTLGIGALFLYAFLSGGFFLYSAITSSRGVVTTRPYEESLQYEAKLHKYRVTKESGIRIEALTGEKELSFRILSGEQTPLNLNTFRYQAFYLPDSSNDQSGTLRKRDDGLYAANPPLNRPGTWLIEIEDSTTTPQLYWKKQVLFR